MKKPKPETPEQAKRRVLKSLLASYRLKSVPDSLKEDFDKIVAEPLLKEKPETKPRINRRIELEDKTFE